MINSQSLIINTEQSYYTSQNIMRTLCSEINMGYHMYNRKDDKEITFFLYSCVE